MTNPITLALILMHLLAGPQRAPQPLQATFHAYTVGKGTYYSRNLLERVAVERGLRMGNAHGWATYPDCKRIGEVIHVSVYNPVKGRWSPWTTKRIADCSQPKDYARHMKEHLIELSYSDAVFYGYRGEGRTQIRYWLEGSK